MISSTSNATIKRIRALRDRKERQRSGLCFLEGIRLVGEAVQSGAEVETIITAPDVLSSVFAFELVQKQRDAGVTIIEVTREVFESLSAKDGPQGLAAVVRQRWHVLAEGDPHKGLCWVALDSAQDPGNVGTVTRTMDAVGATGLILLGSATDPYDPAALRASMGAAFDVPLVRATAEAFIDWTQQHQMQVVGTSDKATVRYDRADYRQPLVLLMGSERQGLSTAMMAACELMVSVPMRGRSDSLNLAVATGVMLYTLDQRFNP